MNDQTSPTLDQVAALIEQAITALFAPILLLVSDLEERVNQAQQAAQGLESITADPDSQRIGLLDARRAAQRQVAANRLELLGLQIERYLEGVYRRWPELRPRPHPADDPRSFRTRRAVQVSHVTGPSSINAGRSSTNW